MTTDTQHREAVLHWMRHSLRLCEHCISQPDPRQTFQQRQALIDELAMHRLVLDSLRLNKRITGAKPNAWYAYLVQHAELQIMRYSGRLSEPEFFERCRILRQERDT